MSLLPDLKKKDKVFIGIVSLIFLIISLIGWFILGEIILIVDLTGIAAGFLLMQVSLSRRLDKVYQACSRNYNQIEALFSMFSILKVRSSLPPMRGWAISPDFANVIISLIYEHKPGLVLELGSGVSTIIVAYCLEAIGEGVIVSVEHEERFAHISKDNLAKHGLRNIATVIHTPLKEITIEDSRWNWYDPTAFEKVGAIDFLIIDGPPDVIQDSSRYPALPILFNRLSDNAVVLVDDGVYESVKLAVDSWLKEFDCFDIEETNTEKKCLILRKRGAKERVP